jgi:hypothetical protein
MSSNPVEIIRYELHNFSPKNTLIQRQFLCYRLGEDCVESKSFDQLWNIIQRYQHTNNLNHNKIYSRHQELQTWNNLDSLSKFQLQMKAMYYDIIPIKKTNRKGLILLIKVMNNDFSALYDSYTLSKLSGIDIKMIANLLEVKYLSFDSKNSIRVLIELNFRKRKLPEDKIRLINNSLMDDKITEYRYIKHKFIVDGSPMNRMSELRDIVSEITFINKNLNEADIYLYDSYVEYIQGYTFDLMF